MIITDSAKAILNKMMADENKDGLSFEIIKAGCHGQLLVDFVSADECYASINGIPVKMSDDVAEALANITLTEQYGSLVFQSAGCGGGCHGGCHSDDEEGGCCGGGCCEGEENEDGCCGGCGCH